MGKGGGKGGKGRVGKFLGLATGIAFGFAGGAWGMFKSVSAFSRVMYGLSLGSAIGGLFDKQSGQTTPESTFDSKNNQVTSEGTIPIIYGQTKVGGLQTYHKMDIDGKKLEKHVVLCEGKIHDIFGVTANGYLTGVKRPNDKDTNRHVNVFGIRNNKFEDATVRIDSGYKSKRGWSGFAAKLNSKKSGQQAIYQDDIDYSDFQKFPKLVLTAGGREVVIFLTDDNTNIDPKYSLACNTFGKVYQIILGDTYLSMLQEDGWEIVDPVISQDSPSKLQSIPVTNCYKKDVMLKINGDQDAKESTVYTFLGGSQQSSPSTYKTTGGYPNMAYVSADLRYNDKMGAGNPTITAIVRGMEVYDWRTKTTGYSKNPVVCLYDYMTNKVYGAGQYISPEILDMESFTEIANYCDEVITYNDPYGVTKSEPRYQLDINLNETKTHLENIQAILNSFLGFIIFSNNKIKIRCEKMETPVYAFNDDNIIENTLSYKSQSIDQSPNKFNITYVEPALDYTAVKLIVEDTTNQLPPPVGVGRPIEQDIELKGVRRQTQCLRIGKIARDIIRLCPITITFKTGLMASHLEAGDVVTVSKTYIDENGEKQTLFKNQQARITEIKEEDGTFEITAKQYNPSIYDDTFGSSLKVFAPTENNSKDINLFPNTVKPVSNVQFTQFYRGKVNGKPMYDVLCVFEPPDDIEYRTAEVYVQIISGGKTGEWKYYGEYDAMFTIVGNNRGDIIVVRIVPVDSKYNAHEESVVQKAYTIVSKFGVPAAPTNLKLEVKDTAKFSWSPVTNTDVERYEISLTGNFNEGAMMTNSTEYNITLFNRKGSIYVRAVNIDGVAGSSTYLTYNYPKPNAPVIERVKSLKGSAQVLLGITPTMPAPIIGIKYRIDNREIDSKETIFTYVNEAGVYSFTAAYVDYFGYGAWSPETALTIKVDISQELLNKAQEAINKVESIDSVIANRINSESKNIKTQILKDVDGREKKNLESARLMQQQITDTKNKLESTKTQMADIIQQKITDLQGKWETSKTQTQNIIDSAIRNLNGKEIVSRINQSAGGTRIDGRLLHVTSDALFDKNVIARHIESGSITADKLASGTIDLQALNASINAGSVHLDADGMRVQSSAGSYTQYNQEGIRWFDKNGKPFGTVQQMVIGTAMDGDYVRLNWAETPTVIIIPARQKYMETNNAGNDGGGIFINEARGVSPRGFTVYSFVEKTSNACYYTGAEWSRYSQYFKAQQPKYESWIP